MSNSKTAVKWIGAVVVTVALVVALIFAGRGGGEVSQEGEGDTGRSVSVVTTKAESRVFESKTAVSGEVRAKTSAVVAARVDGTLEEIYVDEGDAVVGGETKLFQIDRVELERAVEIARAEVSVAECAVREKEALVEQVEADYAKAEIDYERYKRLYENDKAVTKNAFEVQELRFRQLVAAVKHGKVLVELSSKQHKQSEANLEIAQKRLSDAVVVAPLSGVVSRRYMEEGERAKAGAAVVMIEDPAVAEISANLPEEQYGRVSVGETVMRVKVGGTDLAADSVDYKSPTVTDDLRTFEVKRYVEGAPEGVVAGRIAEVEVVYARHEGVGVPEEALVRRGDGEVVFVVEGGKARMVQVETGLRTDGWAEVAGGEVKAGDEVVTLGQEALDGGEAVTVVEGGQG